MTTLRDDFDRAIGDKIKTTSVGLTAMTSPGVQLDSQGTTSMEEIIKLRSIILDAAELIDSRIQRLD